MCSPSNPPLGVAPAHQSRAGRPSGGFRRCSRSSAAAVVPDASSRFRRDQPTLSYNGAGEGCSAPFDPQGKTRSGSVRGWDSEGPPGRPVAGCSPVGRRSPAVYAVGFAAESAE